MTTEQLRRLAVEWWDNLALSTRPELESLLADVCAPYAVVPTQDDYTAAWNSIPQWKKTHRSNVAAARS